jgi:hypothetical protein
MSMRMATNNRRHFIVRLTVLTLTAVLLTGCGSIRPGLVSSSSKSRLCPNPSKIYIAPFNTDTGSWLVGNETEGNFYARKGSGLDEFKKDYQIKFLHILEERLQKVAPVEIRWLDDLPNEGWLVQGDFVKVYQGSRFLRTALGMGAGETTLQTRVYVYDLSQSKTQYILSFDTGIPDDKHGGGSGSGQSPAGLSSGGEPATTMTAFGSGLTLDATRTARVIRDMLMTYK